jgi:hypothetical protein
VLPALLAGCVSRKLFLVSEPPGATVYLDGQRVGTTPWEGGFRHYGARRIELELPGHERRTDTVDIDMPWWQFPGLDVVTDLLLPFTIDDHHSFSWRLAPVDPGEGTWDDAEAAFRRMRELPR